MQWLTSALHATGNNCKPTIADRNVKQIEICVMLSFMQQRRFEWSDFRYCSTAIRTKQEMKDLWSLEHRFIEFYNKIDCLWMKNGFEIPSINVNINTAYINLIWLIAQCLMWGFSGYFRIKALTQITILPFRVQYFRWNENRLVVNSIPPYL